jgi:aspartate/methionine/tyrosine aminotransferase
MRNLFSVAQRTPSVISLGIGEPDFTPPAHVVNAAKQALDEGKTHYTPSGGVPRLCETIAEKAKHDYKLEYDHNKDVLVTVGATKPFFLLLWLRLTQETKFCYSILASFVTNQIYFSRVVSLSMCLCASVMGSVLA